jgi:hypothetical protein
MNICHIYGRFYAGHNRYKGAHAIRGYECQDPNRSDYIQAQDIHTRETVLR